MSKYPQQDTVALFVEGCLAQMDVDRHWFSTHILSLSLDQLLWRPGIGAFSIVECLNHLHYTFEHYIPKIEQAIHQNPRQFRRSGTLFSDSEAEFLKQVEPPIGTILAAQPLLARIPAVSPDRIVDRYPQLRSRYSTAVRAASELDLANIIVEGSMHPPVCSLGGIVALLAAFDRRHIWQAERVRSAFGFPAHVAGTPLDSL